VEEKYGSSRRQERRERRSAEDREAEERRMEEWMQAPALMGGLRGQHRGSKLPTPEFNGTTDVTKFRRNFEEVARLSGWDDGEMALRLKLTLKGTASDYVQGETYQEIIHSLISRFEMTAEEARRALKALKLKSGQDVHGFADQVMKLVKLSEPGLGVGDIDDRATREFIDAIGDKHLTREFRMMGAIDFNDAVRRVQQYNSDMKSSSIRRFESEESIRQEERINAMEKVLIELAKGQQEEAAMAVREAAVLTAVERVTEALKKLAEAKPSVERPGEGYRPRPRIVCYLCGVAGYVSTACQRGNPAAQWKGQQKQRFGPGKALELQ
jgi:molybdopterin-binding protein